MYNTTGIHLTKCSNYKQIGLIDYRSF